MELFTAHTTKTAEGFKATITKRKPCPSRGMILDNAFHLPLTFKTRHEAMKLARRVASNHNKTQATLSRFKIEQFFKGQ